MAANEGCENESNEIHEKDKKKEEEVGAEIFMG